LLVAATKGKAMKNSNQIDYKVLSRTKPSFLEEDIAEWSSDGYKLVGGLSVYVNRQGVTVYAQAVARDTDWEG
jgi:hypothetical protein